MSLFNDLVPGKRENAFYVKKCVLEADDFPEGDMRMPEQIFVYEWDISSQEYVGHLVDAKQYYNRRDVR